METGAHHFDGSDVLLAGSNSEDVDGVAIVDDAIFVSTRGRFFVLGMNGHAQDIA